MHAGERLRCAAGESLARGPGMMSGMADEHLLERRLSGRRAYDGKLLILDVDEVEMPGGGRAVREVIHHPGAAVMLPLLPDGRILMVRQYRYAAGEILLELPAGKLDDKEEPEACARREIVEETGYEASRAIRLGSFFVSPGYSDEIIHAFLLTGLERAAHGAGTDADEALEVVVLTLDELRGLVRRGEIRDSKSLTTLVLAEARGLLGDLRPGSGDHGEP